MQNGTRIELSGMDWLRVFSAGQVMSAPSRMFRVTHKRAREVLREHLGFCPKGKPTGSNREAILTWLGLEETSA